MSGVIAASIACRSPYFTRHETRGEGAVVVVATGSSENETMVRVRPWKLPPAVMIWAAVLRHALHPVRPFAGHLDRRFDGLGAGVHRQHHLGAGQLGQFLAERPELVVVERPRGQRDLAHLLDGRGDQGRVLVAEVERRVAGEHVEVALAGHVGDPGTVGGRDHHRQRVVVVRAPPIVEVEVGLRVCRCRLGDRHDAPFAVADRIYRAWGGCQDDLPSGDDQPTANQRSAGTAATRGRRALGGSPHADCGPMSG